MWHPRGAGAVLAWLGDRRLPGLPGVSAGEGPVRRAQRIEEVSADGDAVHRITECQREDPGGRPARHRSGDHVPVESVIGAPEYPRLGAATAGEPRDVRTTIRRDQTGTAGRKRELAIQGWRHPGGR